MAITVFKDSSYSLSTLLEEIDRGDIALPDIQRPFVWKPAKVRDLFDSMYRGFPVGNLLFWATGAETGARRIGTHAHEAVPRLMIVDGQQRLTGLYSVLTGTGRVARRLHLPHGFGSHFDLVTAASRSPMRRWRKDPEFIPDISILWDSGGRGRKVREFLKRLEASKGELEEHRRDDLAEAIDRLYDLRNYPFKVLELGVKRGRGTRRGCIRAHQ